MGSGNTEHRNYYKPKAGKVPWYQEWWDFAEAIDDDVHSLFQSRDDHEVRLIDLEQSFVKIGSGVFDVLGEVIIRHGLGTFDEDAYVLFSPTEDAAGLGEISMVGKSSHLMDVVNSGGVPINFDWMILRSAPWFEVKRNFVINNIYSHKKGVNDYMAMCESVLLDLSVIKGVDEAEVVSTNIDEEVQLILGHKPEVLGVEVSNSGDGVTIVHNLDVINHFTYIMPVANGESLGNWWVVRGANEDIIYNTGDEGITFNYAIFVEL